MSHGICKNNTHSLGLFLGMIFYICIVYKCHLCALFTLWIPYYAEFLLLDNVTKERSKMMEYSKPIPFLEISLSFHCKKILARETTVQHLISSTTTPTQSSQPYHSIYLFVCMSSCCVPRFIAGTD